MLTFSLNNNITQSSRDWVWTREILDILCVMLFLHKSYGDNFLIRCFPFFLCLNFRRCSRWRRFAATTDWRRSALNRTSSPDLATYEWPREATRLTFRFCMTCARSSLKSQRVLCPSVFCRWAQSNICRPVDYYYYLLQIFHTNKQQVFRSHYIVKKKK